MIRTATFLTCCFLFTPAGWAQVAFRPDGTPLSDMGGLIIIRQGNQTITSLGGAIFPRRVKVTTATPEGPVVTRFTLPSSWVQPTSPLAVLSPATIWIEMPDPYGLLYIEDELIRSHGISRQLESPPIPMNIEWPLRLRAAFRVGDNLLIENKHIEIRAGESTTAKFDGSQALSIPLRPGEPEVITPPREKK